MGRIKWVSAVRVLGLLLVLVYHFFKDAMPGGFFGVDVFFTFSGYLITALIVGEFGRSGRFRLLDFYRRRFLRIFPPLCLSVLFTLPFVLLVSSDFWVNIGKQAAAALGFVTNYFEIQSGGSYEANLLPHLYVHTWSLAVEMHMYIVWGAVCFFVSLAARRAKKANQALLLRGILLALAVVFAGISWWNMQALYRLNPADPSAAYFATTSHSFPFFFGSASAVLLGMDIQEKSKAFLCRKPVRALAACGSVLSTAAIVYIALNTQFESEAAFRTGFPAVSLCAVALILSLRVLHESTPERVNEPKPLTVLANLSYHIYLFHWPLYIVFSELTQSNVLAAAATFAISLLLSAFVYYGIEPMLHGKRIYKTKRIKWAAYPALALVILSAAAFSGSAVANAPEVTSLEAELDAGYLDQDADSIAAFSQLAVTVNGAPLAVGDLKRDLLPDDVLLPAGPAPSAQPEEAGSEIPAGVTIIGDSVCLGARKVLTQAVPDCFVDAHGSRQVWEGYDLLMQWQKEGSLREYVVVALGTNVNKNVFTKIDRIVADIEPGHRLIFVTPYNGRIPGKKQLWFTTGEYMRTLPEKYPFVTVADWAALIGKQPKLIGSDKIHVGGNPNAIKLYTGCIVAALDEASRKPAKE
jgi:peptidoglycan/LPS O-acetylase OafA/YrhL